MKTFLEADDYSASIHAGANSRVLLLNRVLVGREFKTKYNSTHLTRPPNGYHSVCPRSYDMFSGLILT